MEERKQIGFIGQGWIGRNFADNFEVRNYETVRYALEPEFRDNKEKIKQCDLVFIAVPTPTTKGSGFSAEIVIESLTLLAPGTTAVIKSTIVPGTTKRLQTLFPKLFVLHSPEFLQERTVVENVTNPDRNIVGIPNDNYIYQEKARKVMEVLPRAPYEKVLDSTDAELVKYAGNTALMSKLLFMNILYDTCNASEGNWLEVREAMISDPRIGESHTMPEFEGGRGAGGHCFIKDFEALRQHYGEKVGNDSGKEVLDAMTRQNIDLLTKSKKSLDILTDTFELELKD